jgi:hypothetical protein
VSIAELDELSGGPHRNGECRDGSVRYSQRTRAKERENLHHDADVAFTVRAGTRSLESDLVYNRYASRGLLVLAEEPRCSSGMLGRITGEAPLFERFALVTRRAAAGTSSTSRRSVAIGCSTDRSVTRAGVGMFVDAGSVWETARRVAIACRRGDLQPWTVLHDGGIPGQHGEFHAVFMMGPRGNWAPFLRSTDVTPPIFNVSRRWALHSSGQAVLVVLSIAACPAVQLLAQSVSAIRVGDNVVVRGPGLGFIKGETLARLKDGRTVRVDVEMAVLPKPAEAAAAETRQTFVLSYDLWEERFAVKQVVTPPKSLCQTASGARHGASNSWRFRSARSAARSRPPLLGAIGHRVLDTDSAPAGIAASSRCGA